ncbi:hypothetical protein M409DRAFT_22570 [Zasmidium cellare ATCC 36951]|uniref:AB hydrolase-1 domain-containing protein n=1 Tax=Zasmidium cellare ATCC 36951 TaxID=1080233 RepID=A0A6A6CN00_ZASCE|nr:uncharacterized protein M409DRAFT_22570 [Zasmidium cellare ATCC 36951]KAF2167139.1 hypothetical protein M409DRAFT_22570 [Zasmidium cellare ATCC 36951]
MSTQSTATTRYLEADGIRFAYRLIGNSTINGTDSPPPLLMLNHIRSTIDLGGPVGTSIKDFSRNLISFLQALLLILNTPIVDVLGFSLGGYVAQQLVLDAPDLVHRLVLSGTGPSLGPNLQRPMAEIQSDVFEDPAVVANAVAAFFPAIVSDYGYAWINRSLSSRAGIAGTNGEPPIAPFTGGVALQNLTEAYLSWDSDPAPYSLLQTIQKDVLVTVGQNDLVIPTNNGIVLGHQLPRANLVQYPTSGHGHLFQYAGIAAKQISGFLNGDTWPISPFSAEFVDSIIQAYGGLDRYSKLSNVELKFDFTGATLGLKGRHTHLTPIASVSTTEQKVSYRGLGGPADEVWVFTPTKVNKQRPDGSIIGSRENPRQAFADHKMETPWDDFHFLYFSGYALWQYINFPYLLARGDITTKEIASHQEQGETWRVLKVTFPDPSAFASHSTVQKYYFNDKLELVRHDYAPDVLAGAPAAHYTVDNVVVDGMKFSTSRRVVALGPDGTPMYNGPIPTLINLAFRKIALKGSAAVEGPENVWSLTDAPSPRE